MKTLIWASLFMIACAVAVGDRTGSQYLYALGAVAVLWMARPGPLRRLP